jgi:hypothetical protein
LGPYLRAHQSVDQLNLGGQYDQAVKEATGNEVATFDTLNNGLTRDIGNSQASFTRYAGTARHDLRNLSVAIAVLLVVIAGLALFGLQQRINEYR